MKRGKRGRKSSPKQSLNLPDLDQARSAVLNSLPSKESQRGYRHAPGRMTLTIDRAGRQSSRLQVDPVSKNDALAE